MKESVSALMDGELDGHEAAKVVTVLGSDESLKEVWDSYHMIGDAMRANTILSVNVRQQVAERLSDEPTVLAPRRWFGQARARQLGAAALAASVTFAAVVAWQQLGSAGAPHAELVAANTPVDMQHVQPGRDDPYLMAHQEMYSDPNVMRVALGSGGRH